jgi:protein SCO1/2
VTDKSLYQVQTEWTSDFGKSMKLEKLRGKPQVIALFFTSCEFACPVLVHDVRRIEKELPENVRTNVGFVLVSFDSERDKPEVLHSYREKLGLDSERWVLLRGESDDVVELSALLGVKFKKDQRGQFAHSNLITILNAEGEVVHQQVGLNVAPEASANVIQKLVKASKVK